MMFKLKNSNQDSDNDEEEAERREQKQRRAAVSKPAKASSSLTETWRDEFDDGLDSDLLGDDEDRDALDEMTEKQREEEIFRRAESKYKKIFLRTTDEHNFHFYHNRARRIEEKI